MRKYEYRIREHLGRRNSAKTQSFQTLTAFTPSRNRKLQYIADDKKRIARQLVNRECVVNGDVWIASLTGDLAQKDANYPPGFTLALQKSQDIFLSNGPLNVSNDRPRCVIHEFDADLSNTSSGASSSQNLISGAEC